MHADALPTPGAEAPPPTGVRLVTGLAEVATCYDVFLVDSYGVLHDGSQLYPGAVDCLRRLRAAGKRVGVLTNTPRRASTVAGEIARVGVAHDCYDLLVSAGEVTHEALTIRFAHLGLEPGQRFFYLGPPRSRDILAGAPFEEAARIAEADFVIMTGLMPGMDAETDYDDLLTEACRRNLLAVCANPDRVAIRAGQVGLCAGAVAARYEALGGVVRYYGKPHPDIYAMAMRQWSTVDARRILAVGDALATDIAGARDAGLDSIFVVAGIHADELRARRRGPVTEVDAGRNGPDDAQFDVQGLQALFTRAGIAPTLAVPRFAWERV